MFSKSFITTRTWKLLRDDGVVENDHLFLNEDGSIGGHYEPCQSFWKLDDGRLVLLDQNNGVSDVLTPEMRCGVAQFRGPSLTPAFPGDHSLVDVTGDKAVYPFHFEWSPPVASFFSANKICVSSPNPPFQGQPVHLPGHPLVLGNRVIVEQYASMPVYGFYSSGAFSYCMSGMRQDVSVGRYCSLSSMIMVMGGRHPVNWATTSPINYYAPLVDIIRQDFDPDFISFAYDDLADPAPVIGHDVWIGQQVILSRGIRIGDGAVVGAGAVVTKDVPSYSVVLGNPAQVKRLRFPEPICDRLQKLQWHKYRFDTLPRNWSEPEAFCDRLEAAIASGDATLFKPKMFDLAVELSKLPDAGGEQDPA